MAAFGGGTGRGSGQWSWPATSPADCEAQAAELARLATVSQLRRSLSRYQFHPDTRRSPPAQPDPCGVSGWYDAHGRWRLRACSNPTRAPSWPRRWPRRGTRCFHAGNPQVNGPEALVEMAQRSLDTVESPSRREAYTVMVHVATDGAHLHDGPALPESLRRMILCDTTGAIVGVRGGRPLDIGRRRHIVPLALRRTIELRDRGCRVPGCSSRRIQVHHIVHWEDGGPTDAHNLVGLCPKHHRMHHRGQLGITGNPTRPDGLCSHRPLGPPPRAPHPHHPSTPTDPSPSPCPTSPEPGATPSANGSTPAGSPSPPTLQPGLCSAEIDRPVRPRSDHAG